MTRLVLVVSLFWLTACVIGRSSRPTSSQAAQGPSTEAVTGAPLVPQTAPEAENDTPGRAKPGMIWIAGYWHWDGVKNVWQRGHWEPQKP
ncbi:MAG TPA: YXWGXW repeat-containing protein [Polyangiaceae bacterium]|nr:YXWGXW repeat-containing protein [Polyangiaceae bacterium]